MSPVPGIRVRQVNRAPVASEGRYVLYWMTAHRRTRWNFSLEHAVDWAARLGKPLVVLEALRAGHRFANDRLHRFIIDGMSDNAARLRKAGVYYYPYLEPEPAAGKGLLAALGGEACVVVTDDYPVYFIPRMVAAAGAQLPVRLEQVDANGLLPMRSTERVFPTAHAFRRFVHETLAADFPALPAPDPLAGVRLPALDRVSPAITGRWALATEHLADRLSLDDFPIDHTVPPVAARGGPDAARRVLRRFVSERLPHYGGRNDPAAEVTSGLSPYLHFGHIGVHQVFAALAREVGWSPTDAVPGLAGRRVGWWGASEEVEAFLDQLVTWREVGFNMCAHHPRYDEYDSLPDWARRTLAEHAADPRQYFYELEELETAATHDPLWNAAQTQLVREGRIHNYLRMLWGKKILEWTRSPQEALAVMIELNDTYAVDGRDPNSYSGIFWILGRYDRAWGPERPVFGKVRYMTSENTARKHDVSGYLDRYGGTLALSGGRAG